MRDVLIFAAIFGLVPMMFKRPAIGAIVFAWISIMNPHRLAYGMAHNFPFAAMVAGITLISVFLHKRDNRLPLNGVTILLFVFITWTTLTTMLALNPIGAWSEFSRVMKTFLMVLLTMYVINNREDLIKLVWVLGLSLGFYGLKGGIFTLLTGGAYRVWGPEGSYIAENNSLALAFVMTIHIPVFLITETRNRWIRYGLVAVALFTGISAAGSYSRGALVAGAAMVLMLLLKSKRKFATLVLLALALPIIYVAMPDQWSMRMSTIDSYQQDASALGRINAWYFAVEVASRFVTGGGFMTFIPTLFQLYAPNPFDFHVAHSIYFQVLGEHGYIGLIIFLTLIIATWRTGSKVIATTKNDVDMKWAADLARMCQVSLVGYLVGGAFLSLAYYDYFYYLMATLVVLQKLAMRKPEDKRLRANAPAPAAVTPTHRMPSRQPSNGAVPARPRAGNSSRLPREQ